MKKKVWIALVAMFALGLLGSLVRFDSNAPVEPAQIEQGASAEAFLEFLVGFGPKDCEAQGCVPCPDGGEGGPGCCGWESGCHWSYMSCFGYFVNAAIPCGGSHCDFVFAGYGAPCHFECVSCTNC